MPSVNLVRLGHYFTPSGGVDDDGAPFGSCRTALVVATDDDTAVPAGYVGLAIWNQNGSQEIRREVIISAPIRDEDSFHLSGDCPWKR